MIFTRSLHTNGRKKGPKGDYQMRICTTCGTTNSEGVKVCKNCGSAIKIVNSVVVRTHYQRNKAPKQVITEPSDFNPVQHLQKTTIPQNPPLQSITPNNSNLEYKFHSPNQNHSNQPLQSIPPTPVENLSIPQPIRPKGKNKGPITTKSIISEEKNPIILSGNTITDSDLKVIPQNYPVNQNYPIQPVSVPRVGAANSPSSQITTNPTHPIMAFSSQSMQSQQIEQEMTHVMSALKGTSTVRMEPEVTPQKEATNLTIPNSLNDILINLTQLDANIEASALVNLNGEIIASAISERFDEFLISTITNTLGTISQDVIASLESGDLKFISIFATKGILFLSPIMKNVFLVLYTSSDAKIGLINLARMVVKKKIELFYAKLNLQKSPV